MNNYYAFKIGGAEYQAYILAKGWLNCGHRVHFIFLTENKIQNKENERFVLHPIAKSRFPKIATLKITYWRKIYTILSDIKPDIIYHRDLSSFLYIANIYARRNGAKTILHLASEKDVEPFKLTFHPKKILRNIEDYVKKKALQQADIIIAQTRIQQKLLEKNFNRKAPVVHNIVEPLEKRPDIFKKKDIILWVGNIKPIKNPLAFLEIAKMLSNHKNFHFVMIGRPPTNTKLKKKFVSLLQKTKVQYLGEMPNENVNEILLQAKILVCTSFQEGFPNTFLQAWAREVVVISLYVDPDNIITSNKIGFVSKSIQRMASDLNELITNPDLLRQLAVKSKQYVENHHSVKVLLPKINKIIFSR